MFLFLSSFIPSCLFFFKTWSHAILGSNSLHRKLSWNLEPPPSASSILVLQVSEATLEWCSLKNLAKGFEYARTINFPTSTVSQICSTYNLFQLCLEYLYNIFAMTQFIKSLSVAMLKLHNQGNLQNKELIFFLSYFYRRIKVHHGGEHGKKWQI